MNGDSLTPFLRLALGTDAEENRNWALLDQRLLLLAQGIGAGSPTGPAGGDLSGEYPNPTLAALAVGRAELAADVTPSLPPLPTGGDASKVVAVNPAGTALIYTTAPPATLTPGQVTTTYLADNAVTALKIADGTITAAELGDEGVTTAKLAALAVTRAKIAADAWLSPVPTGPDVGRVLTVAAGPTLAWQTPAGGAPSGPAGGDLTGTYPNPTVGPATITRAKTATDLWLAPIPTGADVGKLLTVTTGPTLAWQAGGGGPPTGAAGGDLAGTYPDPTIGAAKVTRTKTAPDCWLSPVPSGADVGKLLTVVAGPALAWQAGGGGPPTGAAGGDLTGTYPDPTVGALKITDAKINDVAATKLSGTIAQARLPVAPAGLLTANLNDSQVTRVKAAADCWLSPIPVAGDVGKVLAVTAGPTLTWQAGTAPTGTAGGDLSGAYPNPTIGAGKVTNAALAASGLDAAKLTTGVLPVAQVPSLDAAKVTTGIFQLARIPTMDVAHLPDAPAGITTTKINDAQVTDAKIAGMAYAKLTGAPASLPPSGAAGGDLGGTYPSPTIASGAVTRVKTAADLWLAPIPSGADVGKVLGVATGPVLQWQMGPPPSGTASGDLSGTYPGPTVARVAGAALGTTTPLARGDLLVANATPALARLAKGATGTVLTATATDAVWQALTQAQLPVAPNGLLTANVNDGQITAVKLAADAKPWTRSATTLSPTTANDVVSIPLPTPDGTNGTPALTWGGPTVKGRHITYANDCWITFNTTGAGVRDDAAKRTWWIGMTATAWDVEGGPAGSAAWPHFHLDGTGNLRVNKDPPDNTGGLTVVEARGTATPVLALQRRKEAASSNMKQWDTTGEIQLLGWHGTALHNGATIRGLAVENWSGTACGSRIDFYTTAAGTTVTGLAATIHATKDFEIQGSSAFKPGGGPWNAPSDRRTKKEIAEYTSGLDAVSRLRPVSFSYNGLGGTPDDGKTYHGLLADEVLDVMPEMVTTRSGLLRPDDTEETPLYQLNTGPLAFALVRAVQELAARVAALEATP